MAGLKDTAYSCPTGSPTLLLLQQERHRVWVLRTMVRAACMGAALHRSGPHLALPTQGTQPSAHKQEPIRKGGQEESQGREWGKVMEGSLCSRTGQSPKRTWLGVCLGKLHLGLLTFQSIKGLFRGMEESDRSLMPNPRAPSNLQRIEQGQWRHPRRVGKQRAPGTCRSLRAMLSPHLSEHASHLAYLLLLLLAPLIV